jgi:two-component system CheB/CheR fusion protein
MRNTRQKLAQLLYPKFNSFERRFAAFILLILLIIVIVIIIYGVLASKYKTNQIGVKYRENVLVTIDTLLSKQKDLVNQTDNFLLTANGVYLHRADTSIDQIRNTILKLRQMADPAPAIEGRQFKSLGAMFETYLNVRNTLIEHRGNSLFDLGKEMPLIYRSDSAVRGFNELSTRIIINNQFLLKQQQKSFRESILSTVLAVRILLLFFIVSIVVAFIIIYRNLIKRKRAENALQKSERLVRGIIDNSPLLINVKDIHGKYILANRQFANVLHVSPDEVIGKTSLDFFNPEMVSAINAGEEIIKETGEASEMEIQLPASDGLHSYISSNFPLFDEKNKLYAFGSTTVDITPVKWAHEALKKSYHVQQKIMDGLQQALNASLDVLCIINEAGEFVLVSEGSMNLWGYMPKEMMHKMYIDFVAEEDKQKTLLIAGDIMSGHPVSDFTNRYKKKDGSLVPVIWSAKWLPEEKMMYCIARNATEKIRTARELAQSQSRLEYAQKIAKIGNWDWDIKNRHWTCSEQIYHLLGVEKEDIKDFEQYILGAIHPDDRTLLFKIRDEALLSGRKIDVEHRIIKGDKSISYVETKGEISFDELGKPFWFSGTMQDITERKKAELELQQLNSDLEKRATELKSSNEDLERFAYVASHDLQEPLRMVSSFLSLIQNKLSGQIDETTNKYIHFAVDGAERMKILIQDLLKYSRLGSSNEEFVPVSLSGLVQDALSMFEGEILKNHAEVETQALPVVSGNKTQLKQLFQNLIGNALKYHNGTKPVIQIGFIDNTGHWEFFVRDNGIGIDPKFFDKIFIIFQRLHTKSDYGGTGIGLAICKKIVERHGGQIWVESIPGKGSTFYFTLKKQPYAQRSQNIIN